MSIIGLLFILLFGYVIVDIIKNIKFEQPKDKENK